MEILTYQLVYVNIDFMNKLSHELRQKFVPLAVVGAVGASAVTGCSAKEDSPRTYECSTDGISFTAQDGQGLNDLLYASGALDVAKDYGADQELAHAINAKAYADGLDSTINEPIDLTGEVPSQSFILRADEEYVVPTYCEPKD